MYSVQSGAEFEWTASSFFVLPGYMLSLWAILFFVFLKFSEAENNLCMTGPVVNFVMNQWRSCVNILQCCMSGRCHGLWIISLTHTHVELVIGSDEDCNTEVFAMSSAILLKLDSKSSTLSWSLPKPYLLSTYILLFPSFCITSNSVSSGTCKFRVSSVVTSKWQACIYRHRCRYF